MATIIYDLELRGRLGFNCSKVEAELRSRGVRDAKCYLYYISGKEQVAVEVPPGTPAVKVNESIDRGYFG